MTQRPAPRTSSLAGASVIGAGWNKPAALPTEQAGPAVEEAPAPRSTATPSTAPAPPAEAAESKAKKTKTSFYQAQEDADRMRAVIAATAFQEGVPAFPTAWLNALVNRELDRLEKKYGGPWKPVPAGKGTRGRPAGH